MLELAQVHKTYCGPRGAQIPVLSETALTLKPKEFVAVRGPSGCGKSTLLLTCGGLLTPERGKVLFRDLDVYAQSAQQRARWRASWPWSPRASSRWAARLGSRGDGSLVRHKAPGASSGVRSACTPGSDGRRAGIWLSTPR